MPNRITKSKSTVSRELADRKTKNRKRVNRKTLKGNEKHIDIKSGTANSTSAKMKSYSFEELEDKYFGKSGTPSRTSYEQEFIEETVAELVKQLRKHFDLTQEELASKTGMTKSYISKIENNKRNQNVDTILRIIHAFKNARLFIRLEMDNIKSNEFQLT